MQVLNNSGRSSETNLRKALISAVILAVAIIVTGVFFLAPTYTYAGNSGGIFSESYRAQVSPSFYFFGCGMVYNPVVNNGVIGPGGVNLEQNLWTGGAWACKN
jgi:hypothetical protein